MSEAGQAAKRATTRIVVLGFVWLLAVPILCIAAFAATSAERLLITLAYLVVAAGLPAAATIIAARAGMWVAKVFAAVAVLNAMFAFLLWVRLG